LAVVTRSARNMGKGAAEASPTRATVTTRRAAPPPPHGPFATRPARAGSTMRLEPHGESSSSARGDTRAGGSGPPPTGPPPTPPSAGSPPLPNGVPTVPPEGRFPRHHAQCGCQHCTYRSAGRESWRRTSIRQPPARVSAVWGPGRIPRPCQTRWRSWTTTTT
jgi:hypothetical protein